jgi:hypothetical protein
VDTVPSKTLPLNDRLPWNGQIGSLQPVLGGLTSSPMFRTTILQALSLPCLQVDAVEAARPQRSFLQSVALRQIAL